VSTRRVDDLVQAMGLSGICKLQVSKLCKEIDERVQAFLDRPLAGEWPCLWLDTTYLKQREGGRIVSVAAIIAVAANTDGPCEIVGLHIGPSEAETFGSTFLKRLARRGLRGVKLVISDAHEGQKAAIRRIFGAAWQRCRVHWMRNAPAYTDLRKFLDTSEPSIFGGGLVAVSVSVFSTKSKERTKPAKAPSRPRRASGSRRDRRQTGSTPSRRHP
jgi:transposase-like protein